MRKHYYIVNGLEPYSTESKKKLDKLVPTGFVGNVVDKLMQQGYLLDETAKVFYAPDGTKICSMVEVL